MDKQEKNAIENPETGKPENNMLILFIPGLENLCFDMLYDRFIGMTDTEQLIQNISIQALEAFLYQTAKYFYNGRLLKRRKTE